MSTIVSDKYDHLHLPHLIIHVIFIRNMKIKMQTFPTLKRPGRKKGEIKSISDPAFNRHNISYKTDVDWTQSKWYSIFRYE